MAEFINAVLSGVLGGALVGLIALGISLIFRTTGVLNLSTGALAALGAYVTFSASSVMPTLVAVVIGVGVTALIGGGIGAVVTSRLAATVDSRRLPGLPANSGVIAVVMTLGIGLMLSQLIELIWGTTPIFFPNVIGLQPVQLGSVGLDRVQAWGFVTALLLSAGFAFWLRWSRVGLGLRAVANDPSAARLCGLSTSRMRVLSWALGAALAGVAGFFIASFTGTLTPDVFDLYMVAGLLAAIVGGITSLPGAVAGALVISVAQSLFTVYAPSMTIKGSFVPLGVFTNTFLLLLLVVVLLFLPLGLFGGRLGRRV